MKSIHTKGVRLLIALLLTLLSCPFHFIDHASRGVDPSWAWALNNALHNGLIFGRDIIFTYGPLSFLNSRNDTYIPHYMLVCGDLLRFAGIFYLLRKITWKEWFWYIPLFIAMLTIRSANYTQTLFAIFILITINLFSQRKADSTGLAICGLYGTLLFFIKLNYGIICIFLLLAIIPLVFF